MCHFEPCEKSKLVSNLLIVNAARSLPDLIGIRDDNENGNKLRLG